MNQSLSFSDSRAGIRDFLIMSMTDRGYMLKSLPPSQPYPFEKKLPLSKDQHSMIIQQKVTQNFLKEK